MLSYGSGLPPVADDDLGRSNARTSLDLWKHAFTSYFPQKVFNDCALVVKGNFKGSIRKSCT